MPQTGVHIIDWFLSLMGVWGYLIVFSFTILENLFVIGSITPGETMVIAGAVVASQGMLRLAVVWTIAVIGSTVGSIISYWGGRRAGRDRVLRFSERLAENPLGRFFKISEDAMADTELYFHTHGAKTVFVSRFAAGFKNFVPVMAGVTKMPVFWFELYTVISAAVYTSAMCAVGWFLGKNFDRALSVASGIGWVGLGLVALAAIALWLGRARWREYRLSAEKTAAEEKTAAFSAAEAAAADADFAEIEATELAAEGDSEPIAEVEPEGDTL
jgi:membrane protein DedA with SNARE-associated domain